MIRIFCILCLMFILMSCTERTPAQTSPLPSQPSTLEVDELVKDYLTCYSLQFTLVYNLSILADFIFDPVFVSHELGLLHYKMINEYEQYDFYCDDNHRVITITKSH